MFDGFSQLYWSSVIDLVFLGGQNVCPCDKTIAGRWAILWTCKWTDQFKLQNSELEKVEETNLQLSWRQKASMNGLKYTQSLKQLIITSNARLRTKRAVCKPTGTFTFWFAQADELMMMLIAINLWRSAKTEFRITQPVTIEKNSWWSNGEH